MVGTVVIAAGGCGSGASGEPVDAAPVDTAMIDSAPCPKPVVFVNGLGAGTATYTPGPDDSSANVSSMLAAPAQLGPRAVDVTAEVVAIVRGALEPLGVQVTASDPGVTPHLEVVLVGTGWPFQAGFAANAPFHCQLRNRGIAMVNAFPGRMANDLAVSVLFSLGVMNGLEVSSTAGNCMSQSAATTCTFSASAQVPSTQCGTAATDQLARLRQNLGCTSP